MLQGAINAILAALTGSLTAILATRLQARNDRQKWLRDVGMAVTQALASEPEKGATLARLHAIAFLRNPDGGKHYIAPGIRLTIGRVGDIVMGDSDTSKHHAVVQAIGEKVFISDLNTANGTFVNSVQVLPGRQTPLVNGDVLRFGSRSALVFYRL